MRLNHINLCASDVDALAATLIDHFGYSLIDSGALPASGDATDARYAAVVGADGSELVITQIEPPASGRSAYPDGFHFGLVQESREAVQAKHRELLDAGLEPSEISDGFEVWGATWTAFYCPLGDGLEVEINHRTRSGLLERVGSPERTDPPAERMGPGSADPVGL